MKEETDRKIHFNALQVLVAIIGSLMVLAVVGYLIYEVFQEKKVAPELFIKTDYQPDLPHSAYKVTIENKGERTAASVNIDFFLHRSDSMVGTATMNIDYVPAKSKEEGWAVFYVPYQPGDSISVASVTFLKP